MEKKGQRFSLKWYSSDDKLNMLRFKRVVFNIKKSLLELQFEEKNPYTLITFFQPVYFIKNKTPAQVCSWEFLKTLTPHNFIKNEIF